MAGYWDEWQARQHASGRRWVDWADHPTVLALLQRERFGDETRNLFRYLREAFPRLQQGRALSLCCGDGAFEQQLVEAEVCGQVTGIDLAAGRIELARQRVQGGLAGRLHFEVGDVNAGDFGEEGYDAVVVKAALHHIEALETVVEGMWRCLRPAGLLVVVDFVGPSRCQWSDAQLEAANRFLDERVPEALRTLPQGGRYRASRATPEEMIAMDPSEAVRSSEIEAQLARRFEPLVVHELGGSLLALVLGGEIVNHFDEGNPAHNRIIGELFAEERRLMAEGVLGCDFKLIVARRR